MRKHTWGGLWLCLRTVGLRPRVRGAKCLDECGVGHGRQDLVHVGNKQGFACASGPVSDLRGYPNSVALGGVCTKRDAVVVHKRSDCAAVAGQARPCMAGKS